MRSTCNTCVSAFCDVIHTYLFVLAAENERMVQRCLQVHIQHAHGTSDQSLQQIAQHGLPSCLVFCMCSISTNVSAFSQEATEAGALAISWRKKAHVAARKVSH